MKKQTQIVLAIAAVLSLSTGAVVAQSTPPAASVPAAVTPTVAPASATAVPVAPVVAPAQPTVSVPVPVVAPAPAPVSTVDPFSLTNDDLVRHLARLNAQKSVLQAEMSLDQARSSREAAALEGQIKLLELRAQVANGGKKPEDKPAAVPAAGGATGAATVVAYQAPQPVVRSVYGYGANGYAEIYVGTDKILATPGTVLSTGHRVAEISANGVVLVKGKRRETLPVRGSAGIVAPTATIPAVQGLPPAPPSR